MKELLSAKFCCTANCEGGEGTGQDYQEDLQDRITVPQLTICSSMPLLAAGVEPGQGEVLEAAGPRVEGDQVAVADEGVVSEVHGHQVASLHVQPRLHPD